MKEKDGLHPIEYSAVRGSFLCFEYLLKYKMQKRRGVREGVDERLLRKIMMMGRRG